MRFAAPAVAIDHAPFGSPSRPGWIGVDGGRITEVTTGSPPRGTEDLGDVVLAPGFVDLQVNGFGATDFATAEPDELAGALETMAAGGCTTCLPTLVTAPRAEYGRMLDVVAAVRSLEGADRRCQIAGVHLEGPFLGGAPGAHPPDLIRDVDLGELDELCDRHPGLIRLVTLAPEADPGFVATARLVARGIVVAIGHTAAAYDDVLGMVDAGATLVTHLFNGMRPFHHREPGAAGAALTDERLAASVIADLEHVHPAALRVAVAAQPRLFLVTDAVATAMGHSGARDTGVLEFTAPGTGRVGPGSAARAVRLADGTLAGSTLTMERALRNAVAIGVPVDRAVSMATTIPAEVAGLHDRGRLAPGARADLVAIDRASLTVRSVWIAGERIV